MWQTEIGNDGSFFALLPLPPKNLKNQNFEKIKKLLKISSFYTFTKNHNHMKYNSWDKEWDRQNFLSFWAIFCTFTPLTTQKINILKKWNKDLERPSFYTCTKNHDHMMYASWDMEHDTEFFAILGHFLPLYPTNNQGNQNLEKMKNPADIIILHVSSINENNMIYGSWDMECDRQYFFSFWTIFCHFHPLRTKKIKIFNKRKKHLEMSFYICVPWMKLYDAWFLKHGAQHFFSFWTSFCPFTPLTLKIKILKKWKKLLEILSFYKCAP